MTKKNTMVNPVVRRRRAIAGTVVMSAMAVGAVWAGDAFYKKVVYQPPDKSEWLRIEGNFADHPTEETEASVQSLQIPEVTEVKETDPFGETQNAEFQPIIIHIPANCVMMTQEASALRNGKLLRLDSEHAYSGYEGEMTVISESAGGYDVHSSDLQLMPCTLDAMDKMAQGYIASTGKHDLLAYSTTETPKHSLYERELPDMATGYCIDLAIENEDGGIEPFYSRGVWLESNAHRYGFVFSYTEADEEATGVESAPYHLRYVGTVHAGLMHELELSLAAYQEEVKKHTTDDPLTYEENGQTYSVYYVPRSMGKTNVPVPKNGKYEISGNNETGFVVVAEGTLR